MSESLIDSLTKKRVRVNDEQKEYVKKEIIKNPLISDYTLVERTGIKRGSIMNIRKSLGIDIDAVARVKLANIKKSTELAHDRIMSECLPKCRIIQDKIIVQEISNIVLAYGGDLSKFKESLNYFKVSRGTYIPLTN